MPGAPPATPLGGLAKAGNFAQIGGSVAMGIGSIGGLALQTWQIRAERARLAASKLPALHRAKLAFLFRHSILLAKLKAVLGDALGPREDPGHSTGGSMEGSEVEAARAWADSNRAREQAALGCIELYDTFDSLLSDDLQAITPAQIDRAWYHFKRMILHLAGGGLDAMREMKPVVDALVNSYMVAFPPLRGQAVHLYSATAKGYLHQYFRCQDDFSWPVTVQLVKGKEETICFNKGVHICHGNDLLHVPKRLVWPDPPEFGRCDKVLATGQWQLVNIFDKDDQGAIHVGDTVKLWCTGSKADVLAKADRFVELNKGGKCKAGMAFTLTEELRQENY